jgi:acetyl esterase/lipase
MSKNRRPLFRRPGFVWPVAIIGGLVAVAVVAFTVSPWPGALVIRKVFTDGAVKVAAIMEDYVPDGVASVLDVQYGTGDSFTTLDVFYPEGTTTPLGTVIWTHGGAWISGSTLTDRAYFEILASHGYTVVGLNYTYGPEAIYPTAVFQLNDAHKFLLANAAKYNIDPTRIVLAGDSAGAQLSSQLAALITNPAYAKEMDITPALSPSQLQGVVLNCGIYEMTSLIGSKGLLGWGDDISLWSYTGDRDLANSAAVAQMSSIRYVTSDFPATYISGGNADPLTDMESKPMADRLTALGVDVTPLFWPKDYTPALPHEYQFRLNLDAAQTALTETLAFLQQRIG